MLIKHSGKTHPSNSFEKTLNAHKQTQEMRIGSFYTHLKNTTCFPLLLGRSDSSAFLGALSLCWGVIIAARVSSDRFVEIQGP